jgi:hypothetical protein
MTGRELAEWAEYARDDPLPDPYWIGAQVACTVANAMRGKGPPLKIEDFLPRRPASPRPRPTPTGEELMTKFRNLTRNCR